MSSNTFFASATFRPNGFSQATPINSPFPEDIALAISSNVSMRAKLGEQTHNASMVESAIISVMVSYALALSPTPMDRANAADSTADAFVRDITPITSTFRTEISDWI